MDDAYQNVDSTRRFIRQQEASLLPNDSNSELQHGYRTYVSACGHAAPDRLTSTDAARLVLAPRYAPDHKDDATTVINRYMAAHDRTSTDDSDAYTLEDVQDDIEAVLDGAVQDAFPALDDKTANRWKHHLCNRYARRGAELIDG